MHVDVHLRGDDSGRRSARLCTTDRAVAAGIVPVFGDGDPAPAGPLGTGPRGVRRRDRRSPRHFAGEAS
jgi:hypothetical protein